MTTIASEITSLTVVYSVVYSGADQRKHHPDLFYFISEYDRICICESKLDDTGVHNVDLEGYRFIPHNRKSVWENPGE